MDPHRRADAACASKAAYPCAPTGSEMARRLTPSWNVGDPTRVPLPKLVRLCDERASWMDTSRSNESVPPSYFPCGNWQRQVLQLIRALIRRLKAGAKTSTLSLRCARRQFVLWQAKSTPSLRFVLRPPSVSNGHGCLTLGASRSSRVGDSGHASTNGGLATTCRLWSLLHDPAKVSPAF
jgi:hypothetical protein